jgi:hypothetical protein
MLLGKMNGIGDDEMSEKLKTLKDLIEENNERDYYEIKYFSEDLRSAAHEWIKFWEQWVYDLNEDAVLEKELQRFEKHELLIYEARGLINNYKHFFNLEKE